MFTSNLVQNKESLRTYIRSPQHILNITRIGVNVKWSKSNK
nr:MAG TPA_asm: hypothetical protein [Caudoviricetes sp.]